MYERCLRELEQKLFRVNMIRKQMDTLGRELEEMIEFVRDAEYNEKLK